MRLYADLADAGMLSMVRPTSQPTTGQRSHGCADTACGGPRDPHAPRASL